jgi:hypothetical protein
MVDHLPQPVGEGPSAVIPEDALPFLTGQQNGNGKNGC